MNSYGQLSSVCLTVIWGPHMSAQTIFRWTVWYPGRIGTCGSEVVWCACFCLVAMLRCNLLFDLQHSCLFILDLRDICCWRTICRGLDMQDVSIPPYRPALSSYLDVMRIKGSWADVIVGWIISTLPLLCVGACVADAVVVAPDSAAIQVTRLSSLGGGGGGGGFSGHSVWLSLLSQWAWLSVIQSAHAGTPSAVPVVLGSGISVARWPGDLHLIPRQ